LINQELQELLTQHGTCQDASLHQYIPSHSVPVFWFGDRSAQVATISINCGPEEFKEHPQSRRYWGKRDHINSHNFQDHTDEIIEHFDNYFTQQDTLKDRFWSKWESLLNLAQVSYFQEQHTRAYHFDLVPWVTVPVWGELPPKTQKDFIQASQESRDKFFQQSSAKIFLCRGRTTTEVAGPALGFWKSTTPWKQRGSSNFVVEKHPTCDKWIIGWNKWYYSNEDRDFIHEILSSILKNLKNDTMPSLPITTSTQSHSSSAQSHSSDNLKSVLTRLMTDVMNEYWTTMNLIPINAQRWVGVFTESNKKRKLLTIFNNLPQIEFPRASITPHERDLLKSHDINITDTWSTTTIPQVRLSNLCVDQVIELEEVFGNIFERIIKDHPHYPS
jgi:hypothetical protein